MFNFKTIAWKLCKGAQTHVITSISIIAVTVCLIVTLATYIHNAKAALDEVIDQQYGEMDMLVGFDYGQGQKISNQLYEQVRSITEIEAISPISLEMTTVGQLQDIYTLGVKNDDLVKSRYHFEQNVSKETIIISELLANSLSVKTGDSILWNDMYRTVIEIIPTPIGTEPFPMAIVPNEDLKSMNDEALFLLIKTNNIDVVVSKIQQLQQGFRIDIVNEYDFVKMNLQTLLIFIVVLSVFILLISSLLLLSTLQLLFVKLNEQLMILRTLGASTKQIVKLVRIQLLLIEIIGLVLGTILSFMTIHIVLPKIIEKMELPAATTDVPIWLLFTVVICVGTLLTIYIFIQMKKAMYILPLQMTRTHELQTFILSKWKIIIISVLTSLALLLTLFGQLEGNGKGALQIIIGSLLLAFIVLYLIPYAFQWILKGALPVIRISFGKEAYLACQQLIPQIRLNIKIVLSLVALIVILVFGSSVLKSIESNEKAYIQERFEADYILSNALSDSTTFVENLEELQQSPIYDVTSVESMGSIIAMSYEGEGYDLFATDLKEFNVKGMLDNKIVVSESFAKNENISVGDMITPFLFNRNIEDVQQEDSFEVVAIIKTELPYTGGYVDWTSSYAKNNLPIKEVKLNTSNFTDLQQFVRQHPMFHLLKKQEALSQAEMMFNQRWSLFIGVFAILLAATTIGIIQTLWYLVYTNRSQYTIQRLLGLSPNGLVKYLCMQVLTFTVYGLFTGFIVGTLLTRLVALIDKEGHIGLDFMTISFVGGGLLLLLLIIFGLLGWVISRRKLSGEMLQL